MAEPRFCDQCGRSVIPLDVPHVERKCADCGKTTYLVEPGEGGVGVRVEKGDRFTIPAGWLKISLDPRNSRGQLDRPGVSWVVGLTLTGDLPKDTESVSGLPESWKREAEKILRASHKVDDLDLGSEEDATKAVELLKQDTSSAQWWALVLVLFAADTETAIEAGDTARAVLSALRAATAWSMLVFHRDLEEHVWAGYQHAQLVYQVASAAAQTPGEAAAIKALQPLFERLSEDVLRAWVRAGVDIGPRIGVSGLSEPLLRALAEHHLNLFEQRRQQQERDRDYRAKTWGNRIAGAVAGATILTAILALLKAVGVL